MQDQINTSEEDSAVLEGLEQRAQDMGYETVEDALDAVPQN